MARRKKKEETPAEEPGAEATPPQQPVDPNIEVSLALDPRRADVRRPTGAPAGFVPSTSVPKRSSRASSTARRNTRAAAVAGAGAAAALAAQGVTDAATIARVVEGARARAIGSSKDAASVAADSAPTPAPAPPPENETAEEKKARKEREREEKKKAREASEKAKREAELPEEQRKLIAEGRSKTREITSELRGSTVVGGELISRAPGVDIGDVLSQETEERRNALGLERLRALSDVMSDLPSNSLVDRYSVARNMLNQGLSTQRAQRMLFGDVRGTPSEIQKAFDTWSRSSLTNFENPDLFNRTALHAARQDPTLLHDDLLHSIAAAKRAEDAGELETTPTKEHLNSLALARTYGIDSKLLSGMDDTAISQWNARRRDTSGIRPDLHEDLKTAHPREIEQRIADLDAGTIPQHLLDNYTRIATDKFLELQDTAGMSPQDMANAAHNHALSELRSRVRPYNNQELLKRLREAETSKTSGEPPASMRINPTQFSGMTSDAIAQAMASEGLEYVPTTSNVGIENMMHKKGRTPNSGPDTRPLWGRAFPDLDVSGLPEDLKKGMESGDPDTVQATIDRVQKHIEDAQNLGITVPELLGQSEKTSVTGYSDDDPKRVPSLHYTRDPHTGKLTPHGITSGGVGQYDIDALDTMGIVEVLPENHPDRTYTDPKSGKKYNMTHVFTPDPRKITLLPQGKGQLSIQHHVTQSPAAHFRRQDLPTSIFANVEEHRDNIVNMMAVEDYSGSGKKDTRAARAANIPNTPIEQRKAASEALGITEGKGLGPRARAIVESDEASQMEVQRALHDEVVAEAEKSNSPLSPQFKPQIVSMSNADAIYRAWSDINARGDIRQAAKEQDPEYQQDLADYHEAMSKRREDPVVSGIEKLKEAAGSVHLKAGRLAKEGAYMIQRGVPHADVADFLKNAPQTTPIFEGIDEEHHQTIKGLAFSKLKKLHPDFGNTNLAGAGIDASHLSDASGVNEIFDAMRKRLPEDHPLSAAIGSNASGTRGAVIDPNLQTPIFESWRKPRMQSRATARDVAGMNRGGEPVGETYVPNSVRLAREKEITELSESRKADAQKIIDETDQRVEKVPLQNPENLPPTRPGGSYNYISSLTTEDVSSPGSLYMEAPRVVGKTPAVFNSPQLSTEISKGVDTHRGMINNALQARSNMARYGENVRKHQSMLSQADEFDRRAASASKDRLPKQAAQFSSQASNTRAQAQAHFESTGLHMSPEEHRANYESIKNQAIEHSRAEGLTARGYAKSAGEAEFFFR